MSGIDSKKSRRSYANENLKPPQNTKMRRKFSGIIDQDPKNVPSVESSKKSYTDVSIRIWIGDSFANLVSTPSKISIQNPILMVELGNQRRSNPPETSTPSVRRGRNE